MPITGDVAIKANFDFFLLPSFVSEDSAYIAKIRDYLRGGRDEEVLRDMKERSIIEDHLRKHNLVTTIGRNVLARLLAGDVTYSGQINYGALGSSSTAVNNSDTQLGTEVYRKLFASHTTDGNNVAFVDFFYAATDVSGTFQEFGNAIDGTASANTGRLFSHILTGGWTKTSLQSMFVSCQYTIL